MQRERCVQSHGCEEVEDLVVGHHHHHVLGDMTMVNDVSIVVNVVICHRNVQENVDVSAGLLHVHDHENVVHAVIVVVAVGEKRRTIS
jgi:hypothetical protein